MVFLHALELQPLSVTTPVSCPCTRQRHVEHAKPGSVLRKALGIKGYPQKSNIEWTAVYVCILYIYIYIYIYIYTYLCIYIYIIYIYTHIYVYIYTYIYIHIYIYIYISMYIYIYYIHTYIYVYIYIYYIYTHIYVYIYIYIYIYTYIYVYIHILYYILYIIYIHIYLCIYNIYIYIYMYVCNWINQLQPAPICNHRSMKQMVTKLCRRTEGPERPERLCRKKNLVSPCFPLVSPQALAMFTSSAWAKALARSLLERPTIQWSPAAQMLCSPGSMPLIGLI